tara:strand:+ start:2961 stop:3623 length:663 start_codon:yes stop_codon:yes gene_type:complete
MNNNYLYDSTIGLTCGITQTIVGHPLDTIKVIIQNRQNVHNISIQELFRGIKYPILNNAIIGFFLFGSESFIYNYCHNHFISGLFAGIIIVPQTHVLEFFKINEQMNIKSIGIGNKLRYGMNLTFFRECIGSSSYFGGYYLFNDTYKLGPFISGGISGMLSWLITYPVDVVKTRLQTISKSYTIKSAVQEGHLWKGINICLLRGFVVNGVSFYVYDILKK